MAEKHSRITVPSSPNWQKFLQPLFNFVHSTQSGILRFAQSTHDGSTYAVKTGTGYWNGSDDLSSSGFGTDGNYIVIEPVNEYPGGGRWQAKFVGVDVSDDEVNELTVEVSWSGGYSTDGDDFAAANLTTGALTYAAGYYKPVAGDSWYFSCSNNDTYTNSAGTQTYTYFRILLYNAGSSENSKFEGTYVGGYIPTEPDDDTKPVCIFTRIMAGQNSAAYWSDTDGTHCLAPANYTHASINGNVTVCIPEANNEKYFWHSLSRNGRWVNGPCSVLDTSNSTTLGVFGENTLLRGTGNSYQRADGAADSTGKYKVAADLLFRWNPSA